DELPRGAVLTDDWVNIIDVDAWRVSRTSWRSDRPVIGRCGGTGPLAWPSDPRVVRAAYPTDGSWTVRVLSRPGAIVEALGTVPDAWDVLPPHSLSGREFLASLDFFVYFYDSRWAEPSRRPILEAITTGVLAVVPPELEEDFGDAAVYAEPESLRRIVDGYFDDRPAYERQVAEAERIVRERFSGDVHLRRLRALIGDPSGKPAKTGGTRSEAADGGRWRPDEAAAAARRRGRPVVERQRILMVTSNGSG